MQLQTKLTKESLYQYAEMAPIPISILQARNALVLTNYKLGSPNSAVYRFVVSIFSLLPGGLLFSCVSLN